MFVLLAVICNNFYTSEVNGINQHLCVCLQS